MVDTLPADAQSRAQSALTSSPIFDLRELNVEQSHDSLLISGTVSSFYHKQLAQEIVRAVAVGVQVDNRAEVRIDETALAHLD